MRSYWDDEYQGEGIFLGQGSMHDLRDDDTEPKLWRAKSVSRAAAIALHKPSQVPQRAIGFHRPSSNPKGR
jgi:hypothetical protein